MNTKNLLCTETEQPGNSFVNNSRFGTAMLYLNDSLELTVLLQ